MQGYWRLVRGWNALPSMALVLLGAWTGAGKTLLALKHLTGAAERRLWQLMAHCGLHCACCMGWWPARLKWAVRLHRTAPTGSTHPEGLPAHPDPTILACRPRPLPAPVWFMGLASGAVAMASCTINDYFDADIDAVNDPQKPVGAAAGCVCVAQLGATMSSIAAGWKQLGKALLLLEIPETRNKHVSMP